MNSSHSTIKSKIKLILLVLFLVGTTCLILFWLFWELPLISPLTENSFFEFITAEETTKKDNVSHPESQKIVYGFLPYWNLNQVALQPELTHLSYFGLNINEDGTILTKTEDGNLHPGYARLISDQLWELAQEVIDRQVEITLVQFESQKIEKLANNPEAHQNLITALDSLLLAYPITGVNIDIEYNGSASPELRDNFALLVETVSAHLNTKYNRVQLSIDMYASASDNKQLWDVPRIAKAVDYIIVMAYDYHRRSSHQAGPVAPLFSTQEQWGEDIHKHLRNYLRFVPKEKIILGIPFYGYEWHVDEWSARANTYPETGVTASYQRVKRLLTQPHERIETGWDEQALSPYVKYMKDDKIHLIYYENPTSIEYKLEYAKQLDLAGIAIWALGYEGEERDLWEVIKF